MILVVIGMNVLVWEGKLCAGRAGQVTPRERVLKDEGELWPGLIKAALKRLECVKCYQTRVEQWNRDIKQAVRGHSGSNPASPQ